MASNFLNDYILDGGVTMVALIPLSIYTLGLIVQKNLDLRKSKMLSKKIIDLAKTVNSKATYEHFLETLKSEDSPLARILLGYIAIS